MLPVVTFLGTHITGLINGSVAIETVFSWPGVGRLMIGGVTNQDYPVVQGVLLILGFVVIGMNLLVDILYTYIDPRIRYR
jgi:peptide/nickel transport system permease protein